MKSLPGSFTCHRCGQQFDNRYIRRRSVRTGDSWAGFGGFIHTMRVSMCPPCARRARVKSILGGLLAIALVIAVFAMLNSPG